MSEGNVFHELHPELCQLAVQGYQDEIAPAARVEEAFLKQATCPGCEGNSFTKEFLGMNAGGRGVTWVEGESVPQALLRCCDCEVLFNPHTGMIVELGESERVIPID